MSIFSKKSKTLNDRIVTIESIFMAMGETRSNLLVTEINQVFESANKVLRLLRDDEKSAILDEIKAIGQKALSDVILRGVDPSEVYANLMAAASNTKFTEAIKNACRGNA